MCFRPLSSVPRIVRRLSSKMVKNCCVFKCSNRCTKKSPFSFHCFPKNDKERAQQWIRNISRATPDGKPWTPTPNDRVCSAHFLPSDFEDRNKDFNYKNKVLKPTAVPTVFKDYPVHKQQSVSVSGGQRPAPFVRPLRLEKVEQKSKRQKTHKVRGEHSYACPSIVNELKKTKDTLAKVKSELQKVRAERKCFWQKIKRRDKQISQFLEEAEKKKLLKQDQLDILKLNFNDETLTITQNETA